MSEKSSLSDRLRALVVANCEAVETLSRAALEVDGAEIEARIPAVERIVSLLKSVELTEAEAERIVAIVRTRARLPKLKAPITDEQFSAEVSTSTRVEE